MDAVNDPAPPVLATVRRGTVIEARIAARLTQRELAERLGVPEQQVQRWEANEYAGVGLDRLQTIADALGVQVLETITYSVPA